MRRRGALLIAVLLFLLPALVCCGGIVSPAPADYTVETVTEYRTDNGNSLHLVYPAVRGLTDKEAEDRVNTLFAAYAEEMYRREELFSGEGGGYTYAVTEVTVTLAAKRFLSGYAGGVITADSTGYTAYFAYTFNCDLDACVLYSAEDLLTDYSRLVKWFKRGRFSQHFGYPDLQRQISFADMIEQYKAEYGVYPALYFTPDSMGFLVEVIPLFDGYAGYTLSLRQAEKCLKKDNPLVNLYLREN